MRYRFVIEDEVLDEFMHLSARRREQVFRHFQRIADDAPLPGDEDLEDSAGRWIMRRDFNSWIVWFWYDSPVHEVRIVDFQPQPARRQKLSQ
jgi:hypothetical protein